MTIRVEAIVAQGDTSRDTTKIVVIEILILIEVGEV